MMANIDISELMFDPDFVDSFCVIRGVQQIDADGRAQTLQPIRTDAFGSVQPASGRTMQFFPELVRTDGVIEIYTVYGLQIETDGAAADEVLWRGKTYVVTHIDDVNNFSGFVHAIATLKNLNVAPTQL